MSLFLLTILIFKLRISLDYPKYYDMTCIVIRTGKYNSVKEFIVPETYIVVQSIKNPSLQASFNSLNFPSLINKTYKVGDTIHFEYISKKRFNEN